ncbi:hypothetical protein, partial [Streptomyces chumphonensis]|uniref:hypothetical protein n=1 Tax=Streptomyces chumphonensis TaxID=1214925 RepID=UPI003D746EF3
MLVLEGVGGEVEVVGGLGGGVVVVGGDAVGGGVGGVGEELVPGVFVALECAGDEDGVGFEGGL